ncbi:UDP-N-acetylmuramate--L-alanine ligase [Antarcticibacterium flavum]|uniref:UDP-N-acetylmuramate--L-alanine ligase n=1 Tax=Antarcticibacterium flavum TaxID=2058175 RepID=A0A5B7X360_9FLAO|nr:MULTISPECIES: UDP-N-acetylmuramate--L-alanine ligase [Antarcticibacterium]MCM4161508.1 UDP-N-acetylmuramate--L-alanine ligase [Antarcticibacterium sp. W02-3]QCY69111.1 UDP-N-acetylmuramate--L-alanine ligase [Antarcticibacterium flavum]
MKKIDNIQNFYFLGIGGIGMSALARYFNAQGKKVAGYDKTATDLTASLEEEGIKLILEDEVAKVPQAFKDVENTLVVYTPAVPADHKQYNYFKKKGFNIKKRAEVLGMITKDKFTLAVAGTHGKTTTTAILGHLLSKSGAKVTAFLGGISEDINTNLIMQGDEVMVVEADEFDRSFLKLSPNIAAITSMDADHLDIYGDAEKLNESFRDFAALVPENGKLFIANGLDLPGTTVGVKDDATYSAINVKVDNGTYHFDLRTPTITIDNLQCNLPGKHNLQNAVTALAMALEYGAPSPELARALFSFKGVKRRFSYRIKTKELVLIDDYAHHPTEIAAVYQAVKEMHPRKKVLAIFQPHLFSRTRDFADDFAESLSRFDEVRLLDIYPAREKPIEGVTSEWLLDKIENEDKKLISEGDIEKEIRNSQAKVVVMMGAGNIGEMINKVTEKLANED